MSEQLNFIHEAEDSLAGFEEINSQTQSIPFIKLAQTLTPEANIQKEQYVQGLKLGEYFNSITKEIIGPAFNFIILKFERIYIEWKPNRGGFVDMHTPSNAERIATDKTFGKWKTGLGNDLTEYYTYIGVIEGREHEGLVVFSLASTAIKAAKDLNKMLTTHVVDDGAGGKKKAMPYYLVFKVTALHKTAGTNDWYVPQFKFDHYINEQQYGLITGERKLLPERKIDYALADNTGGQSENNSGTYVPNPEDDDL